MLEGSLNRNVMKCFFFFCETQLLSGCIDLVNFAVKMMIMITVHFEHDCLSKGTSLFVYRPQHNID